MSKQKAFTLNELLIVMAIMVVLMGLAILSFNSLTGSRSIEGATNVVSAYLGQARVEAIGVQEYRGVFFFLNSSTDEINLAMVRVDRTDPNTGISYIDLVADRDIVTRAVTQTREFINIPPGIGLQTIDTPTNFTTGAANDTYLGYNDPPAAIGGTQCLYGGVILFDAYGKVASIPYGFRFTTSTTGIHTDPAPPGLPHIGTPMGALLATGDAINTPTGANDWVPPGGTLTSQFGLILFDKENFASSASPGTSKNEDYQMTGNPALPIGAPETIREAWLQENANFLLVNRYNGTLIKGE